LLMQPGEGDIRFVLPPQTLCFLNVVEVPRESLEAEPHLDFIHISDTHLARYQGAHPKIVETRTMHSRAEETLAGFLDQMQAAGPSSFVVHTGDAIDAYCFDGTSPLPVGAQVEHFRTAIARLSLPIYLALGNHDIECYRWLEGSTSPKGDQSVAGEARAAWREALGCLKQGTFYSVSHQVGAINYRFLVLDNGETYSGESPFYQKQLTWLRDQLAGNRTDPTILVMHIPLEENNFSAVVKFLLIGAENVILSIAGHRHTDGVEEISLGARRLPQVRTAALSMDAYNWRRIRLYEDRIEISQTGQPEQVVRIIAPSKESTHGIRVSEPSPVEATCLGIRIVKAKLQAAGRGTAPN
jgi:predicted MPP superfamily phosphohydrolase